MPSHLAIRERAAEGQLRRRAEQWRPVPAEPFGHGDGEGHKPRRADIVPDVKPGSYHADGLEREQPVATARSGELPTTAIPALSERERQIIDGLVKGQSNKTIARAFGIAEATVKVHMKAILRKIPCSNRTQVAIWALGHTDVFRAPWMNGASMTPSLRLAK